MSSASSPLLQIPPELADLVASFLTGPDLLILRLVNKEISAKTERCMLDKNFAELHIILALPSSFDTSLCVVKHDVLCTRVQEVHVYIDAFDRPALDDPAKLDPSDHQNSSTTAQIKRQHRRSLYLQWLEDQEKLISSGTDERNLCEIFWRLQECEDVYVDIIIDDSQTGGGMNSRDSRKMNQVFGDTPYMTQQWDNHRPLQIILNAIKDSDIMPVGFGVMTHGYAVPVHMFTNLDGFAKLRENFQELETFVLSIQSHPSSENISTQDEDISNLVGFIDTFSEGLERLHFYSTKPKGVRIQPPETLDGVFAGLSAAVYFPNIQQFVFYGMAADYGKFVRYLKAHRDTLNHVDFQIFYATGCDTELSREDFDKQLLADFAAAGLPAPDKRSSIVRLMY